MDKYIIRTSDRKSFKMCRQAWDFGSKIRQDFEPVVVPKALEFGTAIHAGLEAYYEPQSQNFPDETRTAIAITMFMNENTAQYHARSNDMQEIVDDYKEREELGRGMLNYYCGEWAPKNDNFKVVAVEQEFEVPVLVPLDVYLKSTGSTGWQNGFAVDTTTRQLYYKGLPVVYQGRIDMIVEDEDGDLWIVDHKTARAFKEEMFHLDVDTQVTSYAWAAQFFLDKPIAGVIYNQIKKSYPTEPKVLKSGKLSKDKSQSTTYDLYVKAIEAGGHNEADYTEFLDYLWSSGPEFVRRFQLDRSQSELDTQGRMIYDESLDMLGNPSIYPNPSEMVCGGCAFQGPCLATMENSDPNFILTDPMAYRKRSVDA